jgi:catechol 2,3-dioxygenase-like lactoylglutathione lyase family enzyme
MIAFRQAGWTAVPGGSRAECVCIPSVPSQGIRRHTKSGRSNMGMKPAKSCIDVGLVVKDINKSLAFYVNQLGLQKIGEMPTPFGQLHRLSFGDSFVKLIDPKEAPPAGALGLTKSLGFRYLTFQVTNIVEVCAECEKAGVPFELPKQELMPGLTIAMLRDPDGNVVELVERS